MTLLLLLTSHLLVLYILSKECFKNHIKTAKTTVRFAIWSCSLVAHYRSRNSKLQLRDVYCNGHNRREFCEMERDNTKMFDSFYKIKGSIWSSSEISLMRGGWTNRHYSVTDTYSESHTVVHSAPQLLGVFFNSLCHCTRLSSFSFIFIHFFRLNI